MMTTLREEKKLPVLLGDTSELATTLRLSAIFVYSL